MSLNQPDNDKINEINKSHSPQKRDKSYKNGNNYEGEENKTFANITQQILQLFQQNNTQQVVSLISHFLASVPINISATHKLMLKAVISYLQKNHPKTIQLFLQARNLLSQQEITQIPDIYTALLLNTQAALPRQTRPITATAYKNYKNNIAVLKKLDAPLAQQLQRTPWPENLILIDFWDGPRLYAPQTRTLLNINPQFTTQMGKNINSRGPFAFTQLSSTQELIYCLKHQVNILHGMTRAHYLFEQNIPLLKAFLYMDDFSELLQSRELVIFAGEHWQQRAQDFFATMRYPLPVITIGDNPQVAELFATIKENITLSASVDTVKDYYASPAFQQRQKQIASGEIMPRILVETCRWTTFLKYCAADFQKAFKQLGCETEFLIEDDNVQSILPALHWKTMAEFKPDAVFMVSHARPTNSFYPRQLPFICFMQDKCGPLARLESLKDEITPQDIFVCMVNEFQRFLIAKGVSPEQTFVMPVPADENMFFPLEKDHPDAKKFSVDVGFVKHGHPAADEVFRNFLNSQEVQQLDNNNRDFIVAVFTKLYNLINQKLDECIYEDKMQDFAASFIPAGSSEQSRHYMQQLVIKFYIEVYSAAWRCQFLEQLDKAGIELALYGNNWDKHERLKHLAHGPVQRDTQLNLVYNFNRINLSINQGVTMHQRLAECALAKGFMMVADHNPAYDWAPVRQYFEPDKEVVLFSSPAELVEKCRYYLDHPQERHAIAQNMHQRALKERTCLSAAKTVLEKWRTLL